MASHLSNTKALNTLLFIHNGDASKIKQDFKKYSGNSISDKALYDRKF